MCAAIEQTLAFEKGMSGHDDGPDADEGAIYLLQKHSRAMNFMPHVTRITNSKYIW